MGNDDTLLASAIVKEASDELDSAHAKDPTLHATAV